MRSIPPNSSESLQLVPDLLSRAASLLAREVARMRVAQTAPGAGALDGQPAAVVQNAITGGTAGEESAFAPVPSLASSESVRDGAVGASPAQRALASIGPEEFRRRASELIESLVTSLADGSYGRAGAFEDQVPLVRAAAPVEAGTYAIARIEIANDESSASDVALYSSNFIADTGYEVPSLLVSISPRRATAPAGGQVAFEVRIAVPAQTPRGAYSGLIQATGCKYVKAVVLFEVL